MCVVERYWKYRGKDCENELQRKRKRERPKEQLMYVVREDIQGISVMNR